MFTPPAPRPTYRGRLAPSPTGHLHLGHARTFWFAQERARQHDGTLILRNDDLDGPRCKPEFVTAMYEDLRWFGFTWTEGPDVGGPHAPYNQSERTRFYREALEQLRANGFLYPCTCSRKDLAAAARAPHAEDDDEPIYPGTCRPKGDTGQVTSDTKLPAALTSPATRQQLHLATVLTPSPRPSGERAGERGFEPVKPHTSSPRHPSLRFKVPDGETISFPDENLGPQQFVAGKDFGDFVVWRPDDVPAYQLACVVDDAAMKITEVVRGADLLKSTARQLLLYRALNLAPPKFYHCPLMTDESGQRLAKRHAALSLRTLRAQGATPESLRANWQSDSQKLISD